MTSAAVSVAGIIGLVGLIVPHLARPFCGPPRPAAGSRVHPSKHERSLPA
ncbi:hypothetical protein GGD83_003650 [Rhodoblastus sphagnicola]|nr:iron chelate uptake ABC transporter family permease subunit [Rhodoblastus sphagnicola]MBB4199826.1 hypothetical protein [Rhodoblastus sphagnicola]